MPFLSIKYNNIIIILYAIRLWLHIYKFSCQWITYYIIYTYIFTIWCVHEYQYMKLCNAQCSMLDAYVAGYVWGSCAAHTHMPSSQFLWYFVFILNRVLSNHSLPAWSRAALRIITTTTTSICSMVCRHRVCLGHENRCCSHALPCLVLRGTKIRLKQRRHQKKWEEENQLTIFTGNTDNLETKRMNNNYYYS